MFDRFIGNSRIKEILRRLLASERLPHSLLFAGAEGIGKRAFALEVAKAFVCQNLQNGEACDQCAACKRAEKFVFPKSDDRDAHKKVIFSEHGDVGTVIPYGKNILVDASRDLERESNFRPYEAKGRFFLIDDADKMNEQAANALLKTLEEPAPTSYIFLITARPDSLLTTIRSRCQTIRFAPVPPAEIETFLKSERGVSSSDAELLAKLSGGSVARALETNLETFRAQRETMLGVLENLTARPNRAALLRAAEDLNDAKNKEHYENHLAILQTLIHDAWTLRLEKDDITNADIKTQIAAFARHAEARRFSAWLAEIENLRASFAVNINRKIATDALFMQMAGS